LLLLVEVDPCCHRQVVVFEPPEIMEPDCPGRDVRVPLISVFQ
jgi:hypothetical protein